MKYRVHYTYFNQSNHTKPAFWEQREKDFTTKLDAQRFVQRIMDNVSVRNLNIQPVP